jgi:hypothetical protein
MLMWHQCFAEQLNIVLVVKTHLRTGATAHVVLFSSDPGGRSATHNEVTSGGLLFRKIALA